MDIRQAFGKNVRALRTEAGMTQEALAASVGVDQAYISRLEAGEKNPTILTLWHIAQALDTTPAALLKEEF